MKKFMIQIIFLVLVIFAGFLVTTNPGFIDNLLKNFNGNGDSAQPGIVTNKLKIGDTVINAELADSPAKRTKGLGGRESLATDSGMLFIFPNKDRRRFWMKGMKIPLDIIWIKDDQVADLLVNVPPPTVGQSDNLPLYAPNTEVDKVLEVNAGFVSQHQLQVGDKVTLGG